MIKRLSSLPLVILIAITVSADSKTANGKVGTNPNIPGAHQVLLNWTQSTGSGITGNNVYRGTASGAETLLYSSNTPITTYTDAGITNGATYYYKVTAVSAGGESGFSNEIGPLSIPTPPPAPTGLTGTIQ